jgi:hypothetical protein
MAEYGYAVDPEPFEDKESMFSRLKVTWDEALAKLPDLARFTPELVQTPTGGLAWYVDTGASA